MYAVTGATGHLGRLVISALLNRTPPEQIVALVRDPARAADLAALGVEVRRFDYDVPGELARSLARLDRLLLISSDDLVRRVGQHRAVIEAVRTAKVGFVAYTSVIHADVNPLAVAPSHSETEAMLRDGGVPHAILRNGWYTENYLIGADAAIAHGVLLGSTGEGRISGASRADYADAAAAVLAAGPDSAGTYELAGDSGFTLSDVATALTEASGVPVIYRNLPEAEYAKALAQAGMPDAVAAMLAGFSAGAANGILADDSHTLSRLIGRPTASLRDVVAGAIKSARS